MNLGPLGQPKYLTFSVTFKNPESASARQHVLRRLADAAGPTAALVEGEMRVDTHDALRWRIASDDPPPKPREPSNREWPGPFPWGLAFTAVVLVAIGAVLLFLLLVGVE